MIPRHLTLRLLTLMAAAGSTPFAVAQTEPAATTPAPSEEIITLDKLDVNEVPIEENIMPTSRPFNSVFGTDSNIADIPRNVTIISREQLSAIAIQDVRDFSKLTSSSYTRTNFGAVGNPDIRGSYADVMQNGMRERYTSNGNGMPIDFNTVESVNIVKGPATVIQGTSAYVGGYVDLITKRPTFDGPKGTATATVGSDDIFRYTLDYGAPVSEKLAYRFSYSGENSDGYYDDEYKKSDSLYGAITWKPNDNYELFLNAYGTYLEYTENFGINRPTQDLIDNHRYRTGVNQNNGVGAPISDPQNSANIITSSFDPGFFATPQAINPDLFYSGPFAKNNIAYGPSVKIDRRTRLLNPGDNSTARNFKVQAIQTVDINPDARLVNNNLFTYTRRDTKSSYYYSEVIDPTYSFETRTEYQRKIDEHQINLGVAARYLSVKSYSDFGFEPAAAWDITKDLNFIDVENSTYPGFGWASSLGVNRVPVPGHPGRYYGVGSFNSDANESYGASFAPFAQGDWKLTDKLKLLTGLRADFLHVNSSLPANATGNQVFAPVFIPAYAVEDSVDVVLPNVNVSLVHKTLPKLTTYATYNYSKNTAGAEGNGGGYLLTKTNSGGGILGINKDSYQTPAELYEVGAKYSALDGKLFFGTSIFEQTYTRTSQGGGPIDYYNTGLEFEVNYQPNRNFYATFAYTIIDSEVDAPGFEATSVNPASEEVVTAGNARNIRNQGLPKNQFNALASYTFDNGFGLSMNGRLHSEINNNWAGTIVIPWQYELDASVFYSYKRWTARLTILNFTDEWNWSPPNAVYGLESIKLDPGIRGEFTLAYKF